MRPAIFYEPAFKYIFFQEPVNKFKFVVPRYSLCKNFILINFDAVDSSYS